MGSEAERRTNLTLPCGDLRIGVYQHDTGLQTTPHNLPHTSQL
jgi:hypothetical protein